MIKRLALRLVRFPTNLVYRIIADFAALRQRFPRRVWKTSSVYHGPLHCQWPYETRQQISLGCESIVAKSLSSWPIDQEMTWPIGYIIFMPPPDASSVLLRYSSLDFYSERGLGKITPLLQRWQATLC